MKNYKQIQENELATWNIPDDLTRHEKAQRETCRYPMMAKQMGLHYIDTSNMLIYDCGAGPLGGVSSVIPSRAVVRVDPLAKEYAKYFDTQTYITTQAEELGQRLSIPDLIIVTNALDHFENPIAFLAHLVKYMRPGTFFAHYHAINNALTHPHEAHQWNVNPELIHSVLDTDFETVWELKYPEVRYGWVNYQGKVGQPAFCGLFRKTTGYDSI